MKFKMRDRVIVRSIYKSCYQKTMDGIPEHLKRLIGKEIIITGINPNRSWDYQSEVDGVKFYFLEENLDYAFYNEELLEEIIS